MNFLEALLGWFTKVTKFVITLVPLAVALTVLFGENLPFGGAVVGNLIAVLNSFSGEGLLGLIGLVIVIWLFALVYKGNGSAAGQGPQARTSAGIPGGV